MMKKLNPRVAKKLIWLALLIAATFFVTSRANRGENVESKPPAIINTPIQLGQQSIDTSSDENPSDALKTFRSTYEFAKQPSRKER